MTNDQNIMTAGPVAKRRPARWRASFLQALVIGHLALVIPRSGAQELVVSRDGQVLRNARIEHVDPDGITYRHNTGDTKIAFEDLPESVRRANGFDPKRAADFRRQEAEKAEADRRMVADSEARRREAIAKRAAEMAAVAKTTETGFTYAPGTGSNSADANARAAAASVAEQMEKWERVRARLSEDQRSLLGNPLWAKSPIGSVQNIIDRRPGEFGSGENSFFTPNYEKRQFSDLYEKPSGR